VRIHIVQKGDTLWKIAKKYGVNFDALKVANSHLKNLDKINLGDKVKVPTEGKEVKKKMELPKFPLKKEVPKAPLYPKKEVKKEIPQPKVEKKLQKKPYLPPKEELQPMPPKQKPVKQPQPQVQPQPHYPGLEIPEEDCIPMTGMMPGTGMPHGMSAPPQLPYMDDCGCGGPQWQQPHFYGHHDPSAMGYHHQGYGYQGGFPDPMHHGAGQQFGFPQGGQYGDPYAGQYGFPQGNPYGQYGYPETQQFGYPAVNPYQNIPGPTMPVSYYPNQPGSNFGYPGFDGQPQGDPYGFTSTPGTGYGLPANYQGGANQGTFGGNQFQNPDVEQELPHKKFDKNFSGNKHDPFWDIDVDFKPRTENKKDTKKDEKEE
jgi:morphogenetic protein associated with SpoVID